MVPLQKKCSVSKAFWNTSLWVLSLGPLPPGSPHRASIKERCSPSKASLTCFLASSEKKPASRFPLWGPYIEKDVPFPEPSLHTFQSPPRRSPPALQVPHTEPLHEESCSISGALFMHLSKSPEKEPLLQVPLTEPLHRERCTISRATFTYLPKSPDKEPLQVPRMESVHTERCSSPRALYVSFKVPKKKLPSRFPFWSPCVE
jgi:hypothetical protein